MVRTGWFWIAWGVSLLVSSSWLGNAIAQSPPSAVVARVAGAIENITTLTRPGRIGYATVWDGNRYVQCRRVPSHELRCEAAGTLLQPSLDSILTPDRLARLAALGWRLDPSFGNHTRSFASDRPAVAVAGDILLVLLEAYDTRPDAVDTETRWVVDAPCPPRNGPSQNLAGMVNDSRAMRATALRACSYAPDPRLATETSVQSAHELIARYGARLTSEFQRLRINENRRVHTVFDPGIGYIQCMPNAGEKQIYCEAQSVQSWPALQAVLTEERLLRLRAAGYADPGRSPNHWKSYPMADFDDAAIAAETLTVLYDAYGYRGATRLTVTTE